MKAKSLLSMALAAVLCLALAAPAAAQSEARPSSMTMDNLSARPTESISPENYDGSRVDSKVQNQVKKIYDKYFADAGSDAPAARLAALNALEEIYKKDDKNMSLRMFLGYLSINNGDNRRAVEVLSPVEGKSRFPSVNRINLQNLALAYYLTKSYDQASDAYARLDAETPLSPALARFAGSSSLLARKFDKAIPLLSRGLGTAATAQEKMSVEKDLAIAYSQSGQIPEALAAYEVIVKEGEPELIDLSWMGYMYLKDKKYDDAIRILELARSKGGDSSVLANLGNAYLNRGANGDSDKAVEIYSRLADGPTPNPVALYNIGVLKMRQEKYDEASKAFARSTSLAGSRVESRFAWNNLGFCYEKLNRNADAAEAYAKASDLDPKNGLFARNAGMSYTRIGSSAKAGIYLQRAKANGAEGQAFDASVVETLVREKKYDEALALLKPLAEKEPNSLNVWFNIGVISQKAGMKAEAQAAYEKALEIAPDDQDTLRNYGLLLLDENKTDEALVSLTKLATAYPNSVEGKMALATGYLKAGRLQDAVNAYKEVLRLDSSRVDARLNLADGLWNLGHTRDARFHYATVLRAQPSSARALNGMGLWHLLQSDSRSAEESFKKAIEADPKFLPAYNNRAIALERLNRKAEAILSLKKALQIDPGFADARTNLDRLENSANMQG